VILPAAALSSDDSRRLALLDTPRRMVGVENISQGTLDCILVSPREVFLPAISRRAAALILVHNHPSGDPTPSEADIKVTRDLIRAGQFLKIDVLDHVLADAPTSDPGTSCRSGNWVLRLFLSELQ
jgi:DNA repair protein RadC